MRRPGRCGALYFEPRLCNIARSRFLCGGVLSGAYLGVLSVRTTSLLYPLLLLTVEDQEAATLTQANYHDALFPSFMTIRIATYKVGAERVCVYTNILRITTGRQSMGASGGTTQVFAHSIITAHVHAARISFSRYFLLRLVPQCTVLQVQYCSCSGVQVRLA